MTKEELIEYCLQKPRAQICYPFGPDYIVVKAKSSARSKLYAFAEIFELEGRLKMTFRCDMITTRFLRVRYKKVVVPAYRCKPEHLPYKSTLDVATFTDDKMKYFVDLSYERACLVATYNRKKRYRLAAKK